MGAHFKLINSETVDVTPQLAADFASMAASQTERDLSSKRLNYLKDAILGGTAIAFTWAKAKIAETGETYRVNGHHSSTMLSRLNGEMPSGLKAHIDTYEVPDKESLGRLFQQIDSRQSARTIADISGAWQGLQDDLVAVPKDAARKAIEGHIWFQKNKVGNEVPTGDSRFSLFSDQTLHPFIKMAGRVLSLKTPEFTTPVVAAMFGAFERNPEEAEKFFGDVAKQGGGNDAHHPASVLDAWLIDAREQREDKPKEQEVYYAAALAWNAFRNHRDLDRIPKYNKKKGAPELD
jgi:hypothetical protein